MSVGISNERGFSACDVMWCGVVYCVVVAALMLCLDPQGNESVLAPISQDLDSPLVMK